ncbi:MAG: hypothetical protein QNL91_01915 [Candidatus Krumholzibacteria bacterium]|nr:hypothetical protein [Candidatus Krumholzibacteria bacterium]
MNLYQRQLLVLTAMAALIFSAGCSDRDPSSLPAARANTDPVVFLDFADSTQLYWQPFSDTHYQALSVDEVWAYGGQASDGARSLKFNISPQGSAQGLYTGGVVTAVGSRDLADYNALTFYARATYPVTLNLAGFGNDNTGNSLYEAGRSSIALTTDWTFVVVPIPDSSKLLAERGLFTFAEGAEDAHPEGYDIWVDEIQYANLSNIEVFRPIMTSASQSYFLGSTVAISGTRTIFQIDGGFVPVDHMSGYFDYTTTNAAVAVIEGSAVRVVGLGTATVNAMLGENPVQGAITVTGYEAPTVGAAAPTLPASDVISMFSGAYTNVPVDTWRTDWSQSGPVEDYVVAGETTKMYSALIYVGIDFQMHPIDASQMTHLHMDVYAPAGTNFKIKLGSFPTPPDGVETPDLVVDATTTPAFNAGQWSSLDIPLADFLLPETGWDWAALGQMVLSGDTKLILVDNIYFHK